MMLCTFDRARFGAAVRDSLKTRGYGARQSLLRCTGIPTGSLQRLIDGNASDIDNILSVCAALDLSLYDFVDDYRVRPRMRDFIYV